MPARLAINRWTVPAALLLAAGLATAAAAPAPARGGPNADAGAKLSVAESPALSAVERLVLSDRLAAWGERQGDPVALVQAAKIRKGVVGQGPDGQQVVERLLARAAALAPGNEAIRGLIADARSYRSRELPLLSAGVQSLRKLVRRLSADRADLVFKGETAAVVYVRADGDADLDLYVYDEYNNLICADEHGGQEAQCRWRPRWTGAFLVDVRNQHDQEVEYVLSANDIPGGAAAP